MQRSYGRSAIAFACVANAGFEIFIKKNYGNPQYKWLTDAYLSFWPSLWTMGEALRFQKVLLPMFLSVLLFLLDATLDRLPENPNDPLAALNGIMETQDALIRQGLGILEKVRAEMKDRQEPAGDDDIPCKAELVEFQEGMFRLNQEKIFPIVGEITVASDAKTTNQSLCTRLVKAALSASMFLSIIQFAFFGDKHGMVPKKAR